MKIMKLSSLKGRHFVFLFFIFELLFGVTRVEICEI